MYVPGMDSFRKRWMLSSWLVPRMVCSLPLASRKYISGVGKGSAGHGMDGGIWGTANDVGIAGKEHVARAHAYRVAPAPIVKDNLQLKVLLVAHVVLPESTTKPSISTHPQVAQPAAGSQASWRS